MGNKIVKREENNGDPVLTVEAGDKEMNFAVECAKMTYPAFLKNFARYNEDSNKSGLAVKMRFEHDSGVEHMWVNNLYLENNQLYGVLDSDPIHIERLKSGDTLEVKTDSVSDWMYVEKGKLVGGYTIKVLYNRMTKEEQKQTEQALDAKIR
jgi:uncharacterized protein YegJ (DUF2314 family)